MKKLINFILITTVIVTLFASCGKPEDKFNLPEIDKPDVTAPIITNNNDDIKIFVNGEEVILMDENGYYLPEPFVKDGRVLVPVRAVCEKIGCEVEWVSSTETAWISKDDVIISIKVGDSQLTKEIKGGETVDFPLDVPAVIAPDSNCVFVPIRAIAVAFGAKVSWDESNKRIDILLFESEYDEMWDFTQGFAVVRKGQKYGFINAEGIEVVECKYDNAWGFKNGFAVVQFDGKYGFIDEQGNEICRNETGFIYDDAWSFTEDGIAKVMKNGKYGYVDTTGKEVVACKYIEDDNYSYDVDSHTIVYNNPYRAKIR